VTKKIDSSPLLIDDYDYGLPDERIAKYPLAERDQSKLLVYRQGKISEDVFIHAADYLPENTLLVYNNTKVIHARILFQKATGAQIEVFCLEPVAPADYALSLGATNGCVWKCIVGNLKKWKQGPLTKSIVVNQYSFELTASLLTSEGNAQYISFSWSNPQISFAEVLEQSGEIPIPPYLRRKAEESDKTTYQTVYSKIKGSVAAPTAGLHFTEAVMRSLKQKHIQTAELTLHIGAGTFQPVKSTDVADHQMHTELFVVSKTTIKNLLHRLGNIIAVGTTTVRTLESLYYIGLQIIQKKAVHEACFFISQWEPYQQKSDISSETSLLAVIDYLKIHNLDAVLAQTQIIIQPGYQFKIIEGMFTNFHQPKSTLLLLVSAFVGENWKRIYDYALHHDFRLLSYGDSSLLLK
jgi:S-adenosylmethionine:tRNA ribosyltransferase-isomerase